MNALDAKNVTITGIRAVYESVGLLNYYIKSSTYDKTNYSHSVTMRITLENENGYDRTFGIPDGPGNGKAYDAGKESVYVSRVDDGYPTYYNGNITIISDIILSNTHTTTNAIRYTDKKGSRLAYDAGWNDVSFSSLNTDAASYADDKLTIPYTVTLSNNKTTQTANLEIEDKRNSGLAYDAGFDAAETQYSHSTVNVASNQTTTLNIPDLTQEHDVDGTKYYPVLQTSIYPLNMAAGIEIDGTMCYPISNTPITSADITTDTTTYYIKGD